MSTGPAIVTLVLLSAAGLAPVLALVGARLVAIPLCPLAGAIVCALAATGDTAVGGGFVAWFVGVALVALLVVAAVWARRPDRRPWRKPEGDGADGDPGAGGTPGDGTWTYPVAGVVGGVAVVAATAWNLRGLATPTVGFDARALWIMRAGWFLQPHQQILIKLRVPDVGLIQTAYPPLVSASVSLAWRVAGNQSVRLGVVVIALLNACVVVAAAFALVEAGRRTARRLTPAAGGSAGSAAPERVRTRWNPTPLVPLVAGIVAAVLMVFVAAGITEPFLTNGYADPIWSLGALGAVAYGLQLAGGRSDRGVALVLVLVAGLSKNEGLVVAVAVIVLIALRGVVTLSAEERRRRQWVRPVVTGLVELVVVGVWPLLMRAIHARGESTQLSSPGRWWSRADASYHGMAPYLHVLVLAAPVAVVGGLVLSRLRRRTGMANDLWAWAGLASGLVAVGGAFVVGTGTIAPWLLTTVHRVTEFSALEGWWIIAVWTVVAAGAFVTDRTGVVSPSPGDDPGRAAGNGPEPDTGDRATAPPPLAPANP
jgi:hypothetical protein